MKAFLGHKQHITGQAPSGQELHDERVAINQAHTTINEKTQFFRGNFGAFNLQIPETITDIKLCESRIEEHIKATDQRKAESIVESQRLTQVIDITDKEKDLQHSMHLKSMDVVKTFKAPAMKAINSVHLRAIAIPPTELVHTKIYEDVCRLHDVEDFDIILKKTPDVNEKSSRGRSPLDYAAQYSFKHGIESLIQNKALCADAFIYVLQLDLPDAAKLLVEITGNLVSHQEIFHNLTLDESVSELDLSDTSLSKDSLLYLSEPLEANESVSIFNLSSNNIDVLGITPIANMLSVNQHMLNLDLSNNNLAHQGIIILVDGLEKNTTIQILNISNNDIGLEGGVTVSRLLNNNNTILCLNVALNKIEDTGAAYILDAVTKKGIIKQLNLASNDITDALSEDIEDIFVKFPSLISLDLSENNFSQNKALKIEELILSTAEDKSNILLNNHVLNTIDYSLELLAETQIINDFE